ncbi:hypothetical protein F5X97DRAFT_220214 [Nemania serpens]|nr:hypothetical protein F5X97DRAFT_220214 [Nemania serpens]
MPLNEMVTSYFGNRYVDRVKLNALLQKIFGQNYNVVVTDDTISVEGNRALTEAEKDSVARV